MVIFLRVPNLASKLGNSGEDVVKIGEPSGVATGDAFVCAISRNNREIKHNIRHTIITMALLWWEK